MSSNLGEDQMRFLQVSGYARTALAIRTEARIEAINPADLVLVHPEIWPSTWGKLEMLYGIPVSS